MKKLLLILVPLMLVSLLAAIDFDYEGEIRTRGAIYNNRYETDGGHVDSRLRLTMKTMLHPQLLLLAQLQFGDVTWGNLSSYDYKDKSGYGGGIPSSVSLSAYQMYIDYRINAIRSNVRVGQQYWADNMGLIIDDSFSGVMLNMDSLLGFETKLGWIKSQELNLFDDDDYNYFLINMQAANPLPWGVFASYGHSGLNKYSTFTLMPFAEMAAGPLDLKASVFAGMHFNDPADDEFGLGAAVKANAMLGPLQVGGDLLFATENGIETLSPYYQNGLYIYGFGKHHDGVNLYWDSPYDYPNNDGVFSLVGNVGFQLCQKSKLFGAAGLVVDRGFEVNAGIEYDVIPDLMQLAAYGAFGIATESVPAKSSSKPNNYVLGSTLNITF